MPEASIIFRTRRLNADEATTAALVRRYEAVRSNPRDPAHRGAYLALATRVMTRGNWVQIAGVRYVWSHADGSLVRMAVGPSRPQARLYVRD